MRDNLMLSVWLLGLSLLISACDFDSDHLILDETSEIYQLYDYYCDADGNEGIVVYLKPQKNSDIPYYTLLVMSLDETELPWGSSGEIVWKKDSLKNENYNMSLSIGMLQSMVSAGIDRYPAQKWCYDKNRHNKIPYSGSWHLPSFYEFDLINGFYGIKIDKLNSSIISMGGKPVLLGTDNLYWTSTEDLPGQITMGDDDDISDEIFDQANRAVACSFDLMSITDKDRWFKKNKYKVRAFKYIYHYAR